MLEDLIKFSDMEIGYLDRKCQRQSVSSVVVGTHVWVEDPEVAWIDGEVVEINGGDITVNCTSGAIANVEPLEDSYQVDVIGEATPDVIVNEFMKGEKEFIEKILSTEFNFFRAIRDGSALMQHMEDFYYITLLEIKYKSFDKVEERKWWHIPIITELLEKNGLESALKTVLDTEMVQARQFVHFAFPRLKWTDQSNDTGIWKDQASNETEAIGKHSDHSGDFAGPSALDRSVNYSNQSDSHPDPEVLPKLLKP
ncbi:unnamed protein product [Cuscuta campestris]|uniref:Myosin N-terminal SH3-like domain-containing protein n=1 Tax=Cuscuta campestris TaxID=132261 RepID=A0A484LDA4_9ASTE|nr:unnamed protein product [Cuscuta campestris]